MIKMSQLVAFACFLVIVSCNSSSKENGDAVNASFSFTDNGVNETLDYSGVILLTDNDSAIKSISPGGYVHFKRDNQKITADGIDSGKIVYHYFIDNKEIPVENGSDHALLHQACTEMVKNGFKTHKSKS